MSRIWEVYVDGACVPNPGRGSWAIVLMSSNHEEVISYENGSNSQATNNTMELTAILRGIEFGIKNGSPGDVVNIYSDSTYAIGSAKSFKPKKNKELVFELKQVVRKIQILGFELNILKVKGHSGIPGNEAADYYANILLE